MTLLDYLVNASLAVVLIVGGYQFYFWCQGRPRSPRTLRFRLDDRVQRRPAWVWIYSGLYYPAIVWTAISAENMKAFNYIAFSYLILLVMQMVFFLLFPIETPSEWRSTASPESISERFLAFVHRFDKRSNCFPSMHVSVAMLTALHLNAHSSLGRLAFLFPVLIAASAVFTKQHYLIDIPAGMALGWICYRIFQAIYS